MKISDIINAVENFAPKDVAFDGDPIGLQLGDENADVSGVLVSVDTNIDVVAQAKKKNCNLIVAHHPLIWNPLKKLDASSPNDKALILAIKNDIALYAAHTNADFCLGGINDYVAKIIGLENVKGQNTTDPRIGTLKEKTTLGAYAKKLSEIFEDNSVRIIGSADKKIKKAAVVNGGGGGDADLLFEAHKSGADVFITADIKHHFARLAIDLDCGIIECGHYCMERFFKKIIADVIKKAYDVPVFESIEVSPYGVKE